ncbi:DNA repair protein rad51 [Colletotrichum truncatum]|uniref:DNA repair protein rad51 n=1 Tax=Colletotrichum truncatum TaxID=5467 RepID=A0ACC3YXA9_COLTU|nr:DNA repair protein rad51 [Colletotrichum truncatum]KAF6792451.1 DNA repair protein rad51 [Colletotrichum truncatum]
MDSADTQYLYRETRLNLEPSSASSIVNIRVPSLTSNGRATARRLANGNDDKNVSEDEVAFRLKNLAPASSVYHRKWHDAPRSFLWRLLEDGLVLSLRVVDTCRQEKASDAPLVLNFRFSVPIQPSCIAFSDPREHDALSMFVLDESNYLYTFTLRPDFFRKRSAIEAGPGDACKVYQPKVFGLKHPHRMVAASTDQVVISLHDGGLVRLDRNRAHDSSSNPWKETIYNSQGWAQGIRSFLPFKQNHSIRYRNISMDASAATSIQVTDLGLDEAAFLFTVCLDHRMRIWNLRTGQILFTGDILNSDRNPQEMGKWQIEPAQSNLLQLVGEGAGKRMCATYSPIGAGEFKFWNIKAHDNETIYVEDAFPDTHLVPSSPSLSDVWTLADFVLSSPSDGGVQLWTLWKNNMTYRVQELELDMDNVAGSWENEWNSVHIDTSYPTAQISGPSDPTDTTEKWLELILAPGRFTKSTLETALSIYEKGLGTPKDGGSKGQKGLAESICSVLASTASLDRNSTGSMDYEQFRASSEIQWRRFYRLLIELDKQRGEAVALILDSDAEMTWVVCADAVSAIRECSQLERLYYNLSRPDEGSEKTATLVSTGINFVDAISDGILQVCNAALRPEIFEETPRTDYERIQYMFDTTAMWRSVSEEDCAQVIESLGQSYNGVTMDLYDSLAALVAASADSGSRKARLPLTDFGRKLVAKTVQETIELQWKVVFSQLLLLVHMEFDWEQEEDMLSKRFDIGAVFRQFLESLRRIELLRWLSKTEITVPVGNKHERNGSFSGSPNSLKRTGEETQTITALEGNVGHLLGFVDSRDEPLAASITSIVTDLCAPNSDIEVSPTLIQCSLIRRERADLALELTPFCSQTPFAIYIQGRVFLALKDFASAAIHFRKAAIGMSVRDVDVDRHSSGLLDDTEWNLLNKGPARYHCHIVALFEKAKAYSYVIEFAGLAIQYSHASSEAALVRSEMLSRQFNAATVLSRFDVAHASLLAMKDKAMQHSSLRKLVDKMCETYHNSELMSLPFPGLQDSIDEILAQRCKSTMDVLNGIPYHQILYSWRIKHSDYRGAATILLDRIHKLRYAGEGDKLIGEDVLDTPITKQYLLLINALSCVDPKQAWIFSEELRPPNLRDTNCQGKRKVVTLSDLRKQYQDELDRIAAIQNNQFGFEADDGMDIL